MKISVIHNSIKYPELPYEITALMSAGEDMSIPVHTVNLLADRTLEENIADLGDVVIYRTSDLPNREERTKHLAAIMKDRILVNDIIVDEPNVRFKAFQQKRVAKQTDLNTIETYRAKSRDEVEQLVAEGKLVWPFIQKPNGGVKGRDVSLVHSMAEVVDDDEMRRFIFQPFIRNNGDFRLLTVGGEMLGIMKRVAAPGSILNNIAQGGKAHYISDPALIKELGKIADSVITAFPLHISGIDVIKDEDSGKLYFLEVNLMPGWAGFEEVAGVGVAKRIVSMCKALQEGTFSFSHLD